ncbi:MarR family winged helix-turn-helix transcriptional regulator [Sphingomonas abaci]|uniref:MarR family transcriptional regulator for hemolysin n=1 Tax=Sphingomonas abaci TaxID=237611 RepID=A0A7W7AJP1_9SPHN|nr:MarR family transcriptional regulator [Sphingomonas abaci]MBB4617277.1 MarR family transcriptional regulator for hemolysin [Sphingomonas abaci]
MPTSSLLQRRFAAAVIPMARAYQRYLDRGLAGLALSHTAALTVMLVGRAGEGLRQGVLADRLGLEAPSVVPLIDQLERSGLVERTVDATDKRARLLRLSDPGRAVAAQVEARTAAIRAEVFAGVDEGDLVAAIRVLERLEAFFGTGDEAK